MLNYYFPLPPENHTMCGTRWQQDGQCFLSQEHGTRGFRPVHNPHDFWAVLQDKGLARETKCEASVVHPSELFTLNRNRSWAVELAQICPDSWASLTYIFRGLLQPHPIMTSSAGHEMMDSAPVTALIYPTDLNHLHLDSDVLVPYHISQGAGSRQIAEKAREVRFAGLPIPRNSLHAT